MDLSHPGWCCPFKLIDEWTSDVIGSFCHLMHYFTDERSARVWTDTRPGTFVLSLDDAITLGPLGQVWGRQVFPDLDPGG